MFIIERNKIFHILVLAFIISLTGGAGKVPIIASGVSGEEGLPPEEASFAKFNDLPMSATSKMNVEKSLVPNNLLAPFFINSKSNFFLICHPLFFSKDGTLNLLNITYL